MEALTLILLIVGSVAFGLTFLPRFRRPRTRLGVLCKWTCRIVPPAVFVYYSWHTLYAITALLISILITYFLWIMLPAALSRKMIQPVGGGMPVRESWGDSIARHWNKFNREHLPNGRPDLKRDDRRAWFTVTIAAILWCFVWAYGKGPVLLGGAGTKAVLTVQASETVQEAAQGFWSNENSVPKGEKTVVPVFETTPQQRAVAAQAELDKLDEERSKKSWLIHVIAVLLTLVAILFVLASKFDDFGAALNRIMRGEAVVAAVQGAGRAAEVSAVAGAASEILGGRNRRGGRGGRS